MTEIVQSYSNSDFDYDCDCDHCTFGGRCKRTSFKKKKLYNRYKLDTSIEMYNSGMKIKEVYLMLMFDTKVNWCHLIELI